MKILILALLLTSTSSFARQTSHLFCLHDSTTENPHYQSWITHFPSGDNDSYFAAYDACLNDGGLVYEGFN